MKHISKLIIVSLLSAMLYTTSLIANDFESIATNIITKAVNSQPKESFLHDIYKASNYKPIWVTQEGVTPLANQLIERITSDPLLSHTTKTYQFAEKIKSQAISGLIYEDKASMSKHIGLEFKMSKLFRDYANFTINGIINWDSFRILFKRQAGLDDVFADWEIYPAHTVGSLLTSVMLSGDINSNFDAMTPKTKLYRDLLSELLKYQKIASNGSWGVIPKFGKIRAGESNPAIPAIRQRLALTGDLNGSDDGDSLFYDESLVEAVKSFQNRHGQVANGVISDATGKLLREDIAHIITKLQLNLDRVKMMKQNDSGRHIMINIPSFTLYFYEDSKIRQSMRVITGSKKHPTPIFSDTVETIVLNPYWNLPTSIIQNEMIPKLMRNPNAMKSKGIEITGGWGDDSKPVSASSIDWSQYRYSNSVPYRFAQVPGTGNALGKIKFLFPNKFSVYMHDTPTKNLFKQNIRAFSHGCIRVQKPHELLETFSTFNDNVNLETANKVLKGKSQTFLALNEKVPVDVAYLTAWVDPDGLLQVRDDIYSYDQMQLKYKRNY